MDARELKDKATAAYGSKKFAKAAELLEQYCRADPRDLQARLRCGDAWVKAGKKEKATAAYAWAAEGFAREGFLPRAIAASKLVLDLDPAHTAVQQMLASLYARKSSSPSRLTKLPPMLGAEGAAAPPKPAETTGEPDFAPNALDVPDFEIPIERGHSSVGGMAAETGPSPNNRPDAIEIELDETPTKLPAPLQPTALELELDLGGATVGEIEVTIEGVPLEEDAASRDSELSGLDPAVRAVLRPPPVLPARVDSPEPPTAAFELELELPANDAVEATDPTPSPVAVEPPPPPAELAPPPGLKPKKSEQPRVPPLADEGPPPAKPAFQSSTSRIRLPAAFTRPVEPRPSKPAAAFTELELEGDSLLHAVEAAAAVTAPLEELAELPDDSRPDPSGLPRIPLFSDLPKEAFIALFERCPLRRFNEGQLILEQGMKGDAFFVICSGRVRVFRTEQQRRRDLATLEEGAFFGEMALLSESPRTASVEAAGEDTQVLEIAGALLAALSAEHPTIAQALKKFCRQRLLSNLMASAPLFRPFSRSDRRALLERFRAREVRSGELIVQEGSDSDGLYVVLSGEVEVRVRGAPVASLREGELFGEMSLLTKQPAQGSVFCTRHTSLLRLPRADFDALVLSHPQILEQLADLTDARRRSNQHVV